MNNALKAISETEYELRVGNYIVLYGGKDLYREYFTEETKLESDYTKTGRLLVDWEHGEDKDPESPGRDNVLGYVDWSTKRVDEKGTWVERVLNRRNEYVKFVEMLIKAGLVGTSSESIKGGRKVNDKGFISIWPLKRDSITVQPADWRMMSSNVLQAVKSLIPVMPHLKTLLPEGEEITSAKLIEPTAKPPKKNLEKKIMSSEEQKQYVLSEEQLQKLIDGDVPPTPDPAQAEDSEMKKLSAKVNSMIELMEKAPKLKDAGYIAPDSEEDHAEVKTWGDYLFAIRNENVKRLNTVYKSAYAEGTGGTGGYLVPTEFGNLIQKNARQFNAMRQAGALTETMLGNRKEVPLIDVETAPTAGNTSTAGGVIAYWIAEAATITESEMQFRMVEFVLHKMAALSLASSEVREDAVQSIDGLVSMSFAKAIGSLEEYAHFRGDGVGKPLGILESNALISGARSAASAFAIADVGQMLSDFLPESWNTGNWFFHPTVVKPLIQLVNNPVAWMQNLRQGMPVTLMGLPVRFVTGLPPLNTAGDVLLVDPSYYVIAEKPGSQLRIAISEHYKFAQDQLAWRVTFRTDGQPIIDNSLTLEDATTTVSPFVALAAGS